MKTHRIRVKVEIVEREEKQPNGEQPQQLGNGEFDNWFRTGKIKFELAA